MESLTREQTNVFIKGLAKAYTGIKNIFTVELGKQKSHAFTMTKDALSPDLRASEIHDVLAAWGLEGARLNALISGHINRTWLLESEEARFVLQWLNPIFDPSLHHDIAAITSQLDEAGLATPRLIPSRNGALWQEDEDGGIWRMLSHMEGETLLRAESPAR